MEMEVTDICMDKEPDSIVTYASVVSNDSYHASTGLQDIVVPCEHVDEEIQCYPREENAEVSECEVKECTIEKEVDISTVFEVEGEGGKDQDISSSKCEIAASMEGHKSENQKVKDDYKRLRASVKSTVKYASANCKSKCTVPQPFALATAKRASFGTRPLGSEFDNGTGNKTFNTSTVQSSGTKTQSISPLQRKPLQPTNKKHPDEEEFYSISSTVVASTRKARTTVASAPTFRSSERAARRKEFFSKLEEKHQALEAEKTQWEERTKEETEAAIKQLRKSLLFKANPMPSFYHEGPPPKVELKKPPPTRAKSPKLGRRKSCSDTIGLEKVMGVCGQGIHPNLNIYRDNPTRSTTNRKDRVNVQNYTIRNKSKDQDGPEVATETFATKMNSGMSMDIAVQS